MYPCLILVFGHWDRTSKTALSPVGSLKDTLGRRHRTHSETLTAPRMEDG